MEDFKNVFAIFFALVFILSTFTLVGWNAAIDNMEEEELKNKIEFIYNNLNKEAING